MHLQRFSRGAFSATLSVFVTLFCLWSSPALAAAPVPSATVFYSTTNRGFNCEKSWGTSRNTTDIGSCFTSAWIRDFLSGTPARTVGLIFGLLAIAAVAILIIFYPIIIVCRYCCGCCGSHRRRPGTTCFGGSEWDDKSDEEKMAAYEPSSVRNTRIATVILLVLGVGALLLTIVGASQLIEKFDTLFGEGQGLIDWGDSQISQMKTGMTVKRRSTNQFELVPPLTEQFFVDTFATTAKYRKLLSDTKSSVQKYIEAANIVAMVIAIVPMVCLVITVMCAVLDVRTCIPFINSILHFVFTLPYGIIGGILLILHVLFVDICAERTRWLSGQPGVARNFMLPTCDTTAPFKKTQSDVETAIRQNSIDACANALTVCRRSTVFLPITPDIVYNCDIINATSDCPDLTQMSTRIGGMVIVTGSGVSCTGLPNSQCDLFKCADLCDRASVKANAAKSADNVDFANAAGASYDTNVKPLLDCSRVMTEFFTRLQSCDSLSASFLILSIGLILFEFLFICGIVVICRGQKRFFKYKPPQDTEPASEGVASSEHPKKEDE